MQCSSGGSTVTELSIRTKKFRSEKTGEVKAVREELELEVCQACGRVGTGRMYAVKNKYGRVLIARRS